MLPDKILLSVVVDVACTVYVVVFASAVVAVVVVVAVAVARRGDVV